jgi:hypothetical protein
MLTGARLREILDAKWEHVDLERDMIFPADSKTGRKIIGKLLGHSQPSTTQRYAHLDADPMRRAVETIEAAMAGKRPESQTKSLRAASNPRNADDHVAVALANGRAFSRLAQGRSRFGVHVRALSFMRL